MEKMTKRKPPKTVAENAAAYRRRREKPDHNLKWAARGRCAAAIKSGKLIRGPCENCGAEKTDAHHDDYSKPLDVRWLCRPCHGVVHRKSHCIHGHALTDDNIGRSNVGERICLKCKIQFQKQYNERVRAAKQNGDQA